MSLVKCNECGKEISNKANSCPHCGCPLSSVPQKTSSLKKQQPQKKRSHIILFSVIILLCFIAYLTSYLPGSSYTPSTESAPQQKPSFVIEKPSYVTQQYIEGLKEENYKDIDTILTKCEITDITEIRRDTLLDNAHMSGEKGYRISTENVDNIVLYLNKKNKVYLIKYADNNLYAHKKVVSALTDYFITDEDKSDLMIQCKEKVEQILKSPSTADFASILDWNIWKEKGTIIVQGYVDAQNSFGAEIRSNFQFKINDKTKTIESFIFDGNELIN